MNIERSTIRVSVLLIRQIIKLTLVALLAIGLGAGLASGGAQPFAGTAQATLSAAPTSGDCSLCEECATPCAAAIMCGTACISLGLASTQGLALHASLGGLTANLGWQLSSAELRTPAPPPKLIHIA
jgi:hypothetical protein